MANILIGTDPEGFVVDGNDFISVTGLINASKDSPLAVPGGALQEDNVMAEFNTEPHSNFEEFSANIDSVIEQLLAYIPGISFHSVQHFEQEYLMGLGPQVLEFGCDPDYNAWTGMANMAPSPYTTMRTAAGHLHIGYENPDEVTSRAISRMCDVFAGLPSMVMQPDCKRREMYGKAGAMRYKPYGVEYRVLSNFWLNSTDTRRWAWDAMHLAVDSLPEHDRILAEIGDVQQIINSNDVTKAKQVCDNMGIAYVS